MKKTWLKLEENKYFKSWALIESNKSREDTVQFIVQKNPELKEIFQPKASFLDPIKYITDTPQVKENKTDWKRLSDFIEENGYSFNYTPVLQKICQIMMIDSDVIFPLLSYNSIIIKSNTQKRKNFYKIPQFDIKICNTCFENSESIDDPFFKRYSFDPTFSFGVLLYEMLHRQQYDPTKNEIVFNGWHNTLIEICMLNQEQEKELASKSSLFPQNEMQKSHAKLVPIKERYMSTKHIQQKQSSASEKISKVTLKTILFLLKKKKFQFPYNYYRPKDINNDTEETLPDLTFKTEAWSRVFYPKKISEETTNPLSWTLIGRLKYNDNEDIEAAHKFFLKAVETNFWPGIYHEACLKMAENDKSKAIQMLEKGLSEFTNFDTDFTFTGIYKRKEFIDVESIIKLGCFYEETNQDDKAKRMYLIGSECGYPEAFNCMGMLFMRRNNLKESENWFTKGISIFEKCLYKKQELSSLPKKIQIYAEICRNLGFCLKKQGYHPSDYRAYFEKAKYFFPNNYYIELQDKKQLKEQINQVRIRDLQAIEKNIQTIESFLPQGS